MSWYLALLVRGSSIDGVSDPLDVGDLLYRLVEATDAEGAYTRALEQGAACGESLTDDEGQSVVMSFLGLADLVPIAAPVLENGAEVYSLILDREPGARVTSKDQLTVFALAAPPEEIEQPIFGRARDEEDSGS